MKKDNEIMIVALVGMIIVLVMWLTPLIYLNKRLNDIEKKINEYTKPKIIYVTPEEPPEEALEKSVNFYEGSDAE